MDRLPHYADTGTLFFYGGWLSSFAPFKITAPPMYPFYDSFLYNHDATTFSTREHWFAAHKTLNTRHFMAISTASSPREAKSMGRMVDLRAGWDDGLAFATMVEGIRLQVSQHIDLFEKLMHVGPRLIAEDSPTDFVWGIRHKDGGLNGRNLLGKAWMTVQSEIFNT